MRITRSAICLCALAFLLPACPADGGDGGGSDLGDDGDGEPDASDYPAGVPMPDRGIGSCYVPSTGVCEEFFDAEWLAGNKEGCYADSGMVWTDGPCDRSEVYGGCRRTGEGESQFVFWYDIATQSKTEAAWRIACGCAGCTWVKPD